MRDRARAGIMLGVTALIIAVLAATADAECNINRRTYDQPWYGVQWKARAYQFHAFYFALGNLTAVTSRVAGLSPTNAIVANEVVLDLAPHVNGAFIQHAYKVDVKDWIADGVMRSGPLAWGSKHRAVKAAAFVLMYAATFCFAHP